MFTDTHVVPGAITVAVSSGKGGVGKTTTAVALAAALTARGVDVVVIDGDIYGPNVHLVAGVRDRGMVVKAEPLSLTLPVSALGFDVVTPVSVTDRVSAANLTMADLFAMAQFASTPQVVIIDMPPGWTKQHAVVCQMLPDFVVTVVAPTQTAVADHAKHLAAWQESWKQAVQRRRDADKRRKLELPAAPTVVSVETMARFVGVPDGGGDPVTVRRLDALPVDTIASVVAPLVSVPATADAAATSRTAEIGTLADVVQAAIPG